MVHVPWLTVISATLFPHISFTRESLVALIAVLGTTISPYLFFWQASQEAEEVKCNRGEKALKRAPGQATEQLGRIRMDTLAGMAFSNVVAFFIILTAASTLHAHGITNVSTCAEAASALTPIAGRFAGILFVCGIVGTGLLAIPVFGSFGRLWNCRRMQVEDQPGEHTKAGASLLCGDRGCDSDRSPHEFPPPRSRKSARVGCGSEWLGCCTVDGGHHADGVEPQSDGQVYCATVSSLDRLARYRCDDLCLCRRLLDLEMIQRTRASASVS